MRHPGSVLTRFVPIVLALALASCAHMPNTRAAGGVTVKDIDLGRSIDSLQVKITDTTHDFYANETVFATVRTDNTGGAPATMNVRWLQGGNVVQEDTAGVPIGDHKVSFRLQPANGLATGDYRLEVSVNGTLLKTETFDVKTR